MIITMLGSKTVKQIELAELWEHFCPKWILLLNIIIANNNLKMLPRI